MARQSLGFSTTIIASPSNATPTIVCSTGPVIPPYDGAPVLVICSIQFSPAASSTFANIVLVRGTATASPAINSLGNHTVIPTNAYRFTIAGCDLPPGGGTLQYSLLVTVNGASGTNLVSDAQIFAFCL